MLQEARGAEPASGPPGPPPDPAATGAVAEEHRLERRAAHEPPLGADERLPGREHLLEDAQPERPFRRAEMATSSEFAFGLSEQGKARPRSNPVML